MLKGGALEKGLLVFGFVGSLVQLLLCHVVSEV